MLPLMTADEFVDTRFDLPDAGQWAELVSGVPFYLQPPDVDHGNVVLNLSKALAAHVQETGEGYACFDLGLAVARRPDTVRFPAACYFLTGPRFAEADRAYSEKAPALIIEVASSNDRRRQMAERVMSYHAFGSPHVWIVDPLEKCVHVCIRGETPRTIGESETLPGDPPLREFRLPVASLFAVPEWWK